MTHPSAAQPSAASVEMIRRLIAFDTTSRDSNLVLIDYVRSYLASHGIVSELVYDADRRKANLFATIGPTDRPGLVLSGHTDVVPIDGQEWTTQPFEVVEKDGKLFGRGTCDMKSFVAVTLAMVPEIKAKIRATPVHLAFSYDEEVGCLGVRDMLAMIARRPIKPYACIVGEPTEMKVIRAHKGKLSIRAHVRGFECHSSLAPRGVNAVQYAAEFIANLNRMGRRLASEGPFDQEFDIPFTTTHTGLIHGGTALNIVPRDCWLDFEFRHLPADDPRALLEEAIAFARRELEPAMKVVQPDTGFRFEELSSFPGLATDEGAEITQLCKAATGANSTSKVAFGTEAGLFEATGIPTIVCGPGNIDQAHKPNEFVALDQVAQCEAFLRRVLERVAQR